MYHIMYFFGLVFPVFIDCYRRMPYSTKKLTPVCVLQHQIFERDNKRGVRQTRLITTPSLKKENRTKELQVFHLGED